MSASRLTLIDVRYMCDKSMLVNWSNRDLCGIGDPLFKRFVLVFRVIVLPNRLVAHQSHLHSLLVNELQLEKIAKTSTVAQLQSRLQRLPRANVEGEGMVVWML